MQEIIKKAKQGGFEWSSDFMPSKNEFYVLTCNTSLWKSLGKACGWSENPDYSYDLFYGDLLLDENPFDNLLTEPQTYAIKFHSLNLTTSFEEAVAWLESVIKK